MQNKSVEPISVAVIAAGLLFTLGAHATMAQSHNAFGHEIMSQQHEISLALSAAPASIAKDAGVWVLERAGFMKVRDGTNGFNCMVQRANDTSILAPTCFDTAASQTIMMVQQFQAKLWSVGKAASDVDAAVAAAFRAGELKPPARGAVGYMLSSAQHLGEVGNWRPHMMIYAPCVAAEDIGANLSDPKNPVRILNPGRPDARIVVIVPEFVSPGEVGSTQF